MKLSRIALLADGIFAITMTILVLQIQVPSVHADSIVEDLRRGLLHQWPQLLSYCGSFTILGIYWVAHYTQVDYVKKITPTYLWMNIFFLMWIGLLPFTTKLLGTYPGQQLSLMAYGTNLILCSLSLYLNWLYATHNNKLVDGKVVTRAIKRSINRRAAAEPIFYFIGVLLTFVDVRLAIVAFIIPPVLSFAPLLVRMSQRLQ